MSTTNSHHLIAETRTSVLRKRALAFSGAFLDLADNPPEKLLAEHFTPDTPRITEHGPSWATERLPFLGETFSGKEGCLKYFELLGETLEFIPSEDTFPGKEGILVDDTASAGPSHAGSGLGWEGRGMASLVGKAKFKAVKTGKDWEEQFIWRLSDFDEDGRIGHWEIWADPLSAWAAVGGENGS